MDSHTSSDTAMMAIMLRSTHQSLDGDPKLQVDPIATVLARQLAGGVLGGVSSPLTEQASRVARTALVMRSRYAEDVLEEVRAPFVILGAGFETFAYRQPPFATELDIYEVDHPATQRAKRALLDTVGITVPGNLRWCPIDFETTNLRDALATTGFDLSGQAVISWLGVTQYLSRSAIQATFEFFGSLARGTTMVFSFVLPEEELTGADRELLTTFSAAAAAKGEPFLSQFRPPEIVDWLTELGFHNVDHLSPQRAADRYFRDRTDGLTPPVIEQLIRVTV